MDKTLWRLMNLTLWTVWFELLLIGAVLNGHAPSAAIFGMLLMVAVIITLLTLHSDLEDDYYRAFSRALDRFQQQERHRAVPTSQSFLD